MLYSGDRKENTRKVSGGTSSSKLRRPPQTRLRLGTTSNSGSLLDQTDNGADIEPNLKVGRGIVGVSKQTGGETTPSEGVGHRRLEGS